MTQHRTGHSRFRPRDIISESIDSLTASAGRTIGAAAGIGLASAAFVATLGLSATLSRQVSDAFDATRATEVLATLPGPQADPASVTRELCPPTITADVQRLSGVVRVGPYQSLQGQAVNRIHSAQPDVPAMLVGIDPASATVMGPHLVAGRLPDWGNLRRHDQVALIPQRLARKLAINADPLGQAITVGGHALTVTGVFDDLARRPDSLDSILLPATTQSDLFAASSAPDQIKCSVLIETLPGAASPLAEKVALALVPGAPDSVTVLAPPDPQSFRRQLERPVQNLAFALSAAAMLIGAVSIGTSISSTVATRISEIGLRTALGAQPRHIWSQLVCESAITGFIGAIAGVLIGAYGVIGVALANQWQPTLDLRTALLACIAGTAVGALAGLLPAVRAARLSPVASLRR